MKREERENYFWRNLKDFKSTGYEKTPPKCSTGRMAADLNYKSYDMSVGTELWWYQLAFNHIYSLRNWLIGRYQISEDSLEWMMFLPPKEIETYQNCKAH